MKEVKIYCDGACSGNPGPGGWGCILIYKGIEKEASGFEEDTTNNRMELTAAIKALEMLKEPCMVNVFTDSSYLYNTFAQKWIDNWLMNGWKNASKKPVENSDLWKQILNLSKVHKITWNKVKGHADNPLNNRCDALATGEIKNFKKNRGKEEQGEN